MVKIIIEGGPKSGKTTLGAAIVRLLRGYGVFVTEVPECVVEEAYRLNWDQVRLKRVLGHQECVEIEIRQLPREGS